ncbi:MAG: hypothetical protein HY926_16250, partial [Elusimicrobia bacterium]|nr:hypothetical protein [Elusimicrobiota bacterium]
MSPGLALVIASLVAGFAAYWVFVFRRLLPLDRELRAVRERAEDLRRFALEVLELQLSTNTAPHALNEMGQRCVLCLHQRLPDLALCWVRRGGAEGGIVVAARGRVWSELDRGAWDFDGALLRRAFDEGGLITPIAGRKEIRPAGTDGASDTAGAG